VINCQLAPSSSFFSKSLVPVPHTQELQNRYLWVVLWNCANTYSECCFECPRQGFGIIVPCPLIEIQNEETWLAPSGKHSSTKCSTYQSLMIGFQGFGYQKKFTQWRIIDVLQSSSKLVHIRMVWNVDDLFLTNLQVPCEWFNSCPN